VPDDESIDAMIATDAPASTNEIQRYAVVEHHQRALLYQNPSHEQRPIGTRNSFSRCSRLWNRSGDTEPSHS